MLKHLILPILFSGYLSGFSQDARYAICYHNTPYCRCATGEVVQKGVVKPDTIHAELLLTYTTRRWGVAHSRDGYVVRKDGEIEYLDNNHRPFPPCVTVWGWVKWEDRVKRRKR